VVVPSEANVSVVKTLDMEECSTVIEDSFLHVKTKMKGYSSEFVSPDELDDDIVVADFESFVDQQGKLKIHDDGGDEDEQVNEYGTISGDDEPSTYDESILADSAPQTISVDARNPTTPKTIQFMEPRLVRIQMANTVQAMKSSLFSRSANTYSKPTAVAIKPFIMAKRSAPDSLEDLPGDAKTSPRRSFSPPRIIDSSSVYFEPSPQKYLKDKSVQFNQIPFAKSILYGKQGNVCDAALFMGRSFRVGWGPGGVYTTVTSSSARKQQSHSSILIKKAFVFEKVSALLIVGC
jgi:hypothetical protein